MDQLFKLVTNARANRELSQQLGLTDQLVRLIEPHLRLFIWKSVRPPEADDIVQSALIAITQGLKNFRGETKEQFWAWCYGITNNKKNDYFRKANRNKEDLVTREEMWGLVQKSAEKKPISPGDRQDLEYAMGLLEKSNPLCREFLWQHYVFGLDYAEIAASNDIGYDAARMRVSRCLDEVKKLVA